MWNDDISRTCYTQTGQLWGRDSWPTANFKILLNRCVHSRSSFSLLRIWNFVLFPPNCERTQFWISTAHFFPTFLWPVHRAITLIDCSLIAENVCSVTWDSTRLLCLLDKKRSQFKKKKELELGRLKRIKEFFLLRAGDDKGWAPVVKPSFMHHICLSI
jgi:hypothetical protein